MLMPSPMARRCRTIAARLRVAVATAVATAATVAATMTSHADLTAVAATKLREFVTQTAAFHRQKQYEELLDKFSAQLKAQAALHWNIKADVAVIPGADTIEQIIESDKGNRDYARLVYEFRLLEDKMRYQRGKKK